MRHLVVVLALGLAACSNTTKPATTPPAPSAPGAPAATAAATKPVAKVVFIDKEHACECTQKAIDASWKALQAALDGAALPVERIHMDTQEAFAEGYKAKRPMMAVPGLYFLADDGAIVEMLQGEVAADQVRAALSRN
ncbi:MAG: hypothetical protein QM765_32920 [Myxococcales bacterium]